MNIPKFLVRQFRFDDRGPVCEQSLTQIASFGRVYLDRDNQTRVDSGVKYVCELVHTTAGRSHFVRVRKPCVEFLREFLPALTAASWKRGPNATSDVVAEVEVAGYGLVKGDWYESAGRFKHTFVSLKFSYEGEEISFTLDSGEAPAEIDAIRKRVRSTVGPAVNLAAVISRQSESRRSTWR